MTEPVIPIPSPSPSLSSPVASTLGSPSDSRWLVSYSNDSSPSTLDSRWAVSYSTDGTPGTPGTPASTTSRRERLSFSGAPASDLSGSTDLFGLHWFFPDEEPDKETKEEVAYTSADFKPIEPPIKTIYQIPSSIIDGLDRRLLLDTQTDIPHYTTMIPEFILSERRHVYDEYMASASSSDVKIILKNYLLLYSPIPKLLKWVYNRYQSEGRLWPKSRNPMTNLFSQLSQGRPSSLESKFAAVDDSDSSSTCAPSFKLREPADIMSDIIFEVLNDPLRYRPVSGPPELNDMNTEMESYREKIAQTERLRLRPYIQHIMDHQTPQMLPHFINNAGRPHPYNITWPVNPHVTPNSDKNRVMLLTMVHGSIIMDTVDDCAGVFDKYSKVPIAESGLSPNAGTLLHQNEDGTRFVCVSVPGLVTPYAVTYVEVPANITLHLKTTLSMAGEGSCSTATSKEKTFDDSIELWNKRDTFDIIENFDLLYLEPGTQVTLDYFLEDAGPGPVRDGSASGTKAAVLPADVPKFVRPLQKGVKTVLDKLYQSEGDLQTVASMGDRALYQNIYFIFENAMFVLLSSPQSFFDNIQLSSDFSPEEKRKYSTLRSNWAQTERDKLYAYFHLPQQQTALDRYFHIVDNGVFTANTQYQIVRFEHILTLLQELFKQRGDGNVEVLCIETSCNTFCSANSPLPSKITNKMAFALDSLRRQGNVAFGGGNKQNVQQSIKNHRRLPKFLKSIKHAKRKMTTIRKKPTRNIKPTRRIKHAKLRKITRRIKPL